MGSEQFNNTIYFVALIFGASGLVLIFVGDMLRKNNDSKAGSIKFLGLAIAAISVTLATSTFFVSSGINRPLHLTPKPQPTSMTNDVHEFLDGKRSTLTGYDLEGGK
ncbi:MAG TPA: hypothetical protein V6C69_13550 [Trichormus sp.]|jgi:hypothetical protein